MRACPCNSNSDAFCNRARRFARLESEDFLQRGQLRVVPLQAAERGREVEPQRGMVRIFSNSAHENLMRAGRVVGHEQAPCSLIQHQRVLGRLGFRLPQEPLGILRASAGEIL